MKIYHSVIGIYRFSTCFLEYNDPCSQMYNSKDTYNRAKIKTATCKYVSLIYNLLVREYSTLDRHEAHMCMCSWAWNILVGIHVKSCHSWPTTLLRRWKGATPTWACRRQQVPHTDTKANENSVICTFHIYQGLCVLLVSSIMSKSESVFRMLKHPELITSRRTRTTFSLI